MPLFALVLTIALWRTGDSDLGLLMGAAWAGWAAATLALLTRGRLAGVAGLLWCGLLVLAGSGALTLTQLAVGAENTRWLRPAILHLLVLSAAGWLAYWMAWLPRSSIQNLLVGASAGGGKGKALLRFLLLGLVAALLVLQRPLGSEHGLFGVQPVEAAKLALLLVLAFLGMHVEELGFVGAQQYRESPLSLLWGVALLLFGVLLLLLIPLVGVRPLSCPAVQHRRPCAPLGPGGQPRRAPGRPGACAGDPRLLMALGRPLANRLGERPRRAAGRGPTHELAGRREQSPGVVRFTGHLHRAYLRMDVASRRLG